MLNTRMRFFVHARGITVNTHLLQNLNSDSENHIEKRVHVLSVELDARNNTFCFH